VFESLPLIRYVSVRQHSIAEFRVENTSNPSTSIPPATASHPCNICLLYLVHGHVLGPPVGTLPSTPATGNSNPPPPAASFADHLTSLPPWETHLEQRPSPRHHHRTNLTMACGGSLEGHRWVIGTATHISWTGAGLTDGLPQCMSS
jgi:hypothetical protein